MQTEKNPIKVGRIPIAVERALNLRLASQVGIFMSEEKVSELAASRPSGYLKAMEEISLIAHHPDFAGFIRDESRFLFLRTYCNKGKFVFVGVSVIHEGVPKLWMFDSMKTYSLAELETLHQKANFVRP